MSKFGNFRKTAINTTHGKLEQSFQVLEVGPDGKPKTGATIKIGNKQAMLADDYGAVRAAIKKEGDDEYQEIKWAARVVVEGKLKASTVSTVHETSETLEMLDEFMGFKDGKVDGGQPVAEKKEDVAAARTNGKPAQAPAKP
jgi:hypothetical protein